MRPYILYKTIENLGPKGQSVGRRKSVKKNAALLHFLAFPLADLPSGVPRGRAPLAGPPALSEVAGTFSVPFGSPKGTPTGNMPLQKALPQGRQGRNGCRSNPNRTKIAIKIAGLLKSDNFHKISCTRAETVYNIK